MHFIEEMTKAERKEYRNNLRDKLIAAGGRLYVDEYSGTVIAIEPSIPGNKCKTFRVAVAYCSPSDKFKKSMGEAIALYRLNTKMCNVIRCGVYGNAMERMNEIADNFFYIC